MKKFSAVYKKTAQWYVGWVEEVPGVNTQGKTLKEAKENLKDALVLMLETNRMLLKRKLTKSKVIHEYLYI